MTQNEKDLLLKDLCARLPYGVKAEIKYYDDAWKLLAIYTNGTTYATRDIGYPIETYFEDCKPYLFPISSMTEEQKQEYTYIVNYISPDDTENWKEGEFIYIEQFTQLMHFYLINHLDYMGLIPMGLAKDATNLNIY